MVACVMTNVGLGPTWTLSLTVHSHGFVRSSLYRTVFQSGRGYGQSRRAICLPPVDYAEPGPEMGNIQGAVSATIIEYVSTIPQLGLSPIETLTVSMDCQLI